MPETEIARNQETTVQDENKVDGALASLPLHDLGPFEAETGIVKRGPGRPKKIEKKPTRADLEYHAKMVIEKQKFVDSDPLVALIESNPHDTLALLHRIKLDVAREASILHFQRIESDKYGRDTSAISIRRIKALEDIAKIELKLREVDQDSINLHSEKLQNVLKLWAETMRDVAQEVLPAELATLFLNRLATAMDNWEEKAQNVLR